MVTLKCVWCGQSVEPYLSELVTAIEERKAYQCEEAGQ